MKTVVVLSGGMDSATLLYSRLAEDERLAALSVNYGQRHVKELVAARNLCNKLGIVHRVADLTLVRDLVAGSALTSSSDLAVPEGHYADESMKLTVVPNRNMILLSLAVGWAVSMEFDAVAFGVHAGDHAIYPDCRKEFADAMSEAARLCDWREIKLLYPFVSMTKADIALLGSRLGVPFDLTWSCYNGRRLHCGKCGTCVERHEAFALAGVADPTRYEEA
jgi:7-cyano-7-deazaguanine synthase